VIAGLPRTRDRLESRDIVELRELKKQQPDLAPAVDLQIELLAIHRRVAPRISLPAALLGPSSRAPRPDGRPMLTWDLLPLEWSEFRAVLRETLEALLRSGDLEPSASQYLTGLAREGNRLPVFLEAWFRNRIEGRPLPHAHDGRPGELPRIDDAVLDSPLALAFRPFLARCAEAVAPHLVLDEWARGTCPLCGGEPELSIVSYPSNRLLLCGRCSLRWPFPDRRCPYCDNADPDRLRTFASADRVYQLTACDRCRRYLKTYDERHARRATIPAVDVIRMLPLDALAIQRGYQ
jgi:hypothetical protein